MRYGAPYDWHGDERECDDDTCERCYAPPPPDVMSFGPFNWTPERLAVLDELLDELLARP